MASPRPEAARFAATKIQPARPRARRITRPALEAALADAALTRRVVVLHAPAGYDKTTALASLLDVLPAGTAVAWVSLDTDDDAARLFACLAAALEPFDLPWRTLPEALVPQVATGGDGARRALTELLNALAHADAPHGVIVLEDLHRVADRSLLALGDALIERLPANWTVVLSSRERRRWRWPAGAQPANWSSSTPTRCASVPTKRPRWWRPKGWTTPPRRPARRPPR